MEAGRRAVRRLFVSRLHWTIGTDMLKSYFEKFGAVNRAQVIFDLKTGFSKGFGFVSMSTEEATNNVLRVNRHEINGMTVIVAESKSPIKSDVRPANLSPDTTVPE